MQTREEKAAERRRKREQRAAAKAAKRAAWVRERAQSKAASKPEPPPQRRRYEPTEEQKERAAKYHAELFTNKSFQNANDATRDHRFHIFAVAPLFHSKCRCMEAVVEAACPGRPPTKHLCAICAYDKVAAAAALVVQAGVDGQRVKLEPLLDTLMELDALGIRPAFFPDPDADSHE